MKRFLKGLHRYLYLGTVVFFFFLLYPLLYYFSRKPERYARLNVLRRLLGFVSSAAAGLFYSYTFSEEIDWSRRYIICANHTSSLDITAVTLLVRGNFAFIGKEELLHNPVTGLFFKTIDIPVDRKSRMSSFRAFKKADEYLQKGMSVVIFPEGKIPDDYPPRLSDFKSGPFRLAIEHQIPIIPVTIRDTWRKMWDDGSLLGSKPGISHIYVHSRVETQGLTLDDADELSGRIFSIIKEGLTENET
ncbi:lysophospholipid acyltransferase family protein [Arcticibacter sp. MXS-1]|uniref:lysophospholipid acyltransferase family protein n=1 Tax=Arcticibacter sp. MXS-1 TaxID=3341726 RepID=UPI0035A8E5CA